MKTILEYINEAQGHKQGALVFPNISSLILYVYELEGQISDGKYENASPLDHWKWILDIKTFKVGKVPGLYIGSTPNTFNRRTNKWENTTRKTKSEWLADDHTKTIETLKKSCKSAGIDPSVYKDVENDLRMPAKKYNIDDFVTQYIKNAEISIEDKDENYENTDWSYRLIGYGALGHVVDKSDLGDILRYQYELRSIIERMSMDWLNNKDNVTVEGLVDEIEKLDYLKKYYNKCKSFLTNELIGKWLDEMKEYDKTELKKDLKKMNLAVNTIINRNYTNG